MKKRMGLLRLLGLMGFLSIQALSPMNPIQAQDSARIALRVDNLHFFVENNYSGSRLDGYTLPGFVLRPRVVWQMEPKVHVEAGVHWLHYWGAASYPANRSLEVWNPVSDTTARIHMIPWLQARIQFTPWLNLVMGSLDNNRCHRLPTPLYNPERAFAADPEAGIQLMVNHRAVQADVWVDWREFIWNHSPQQERFTLGFSTRARLHPADSWELYVPLHAVITHRGGEGVTDSTLDMHSLFNAAAGVGLEHHTTDLSLATEVYVMGYLNPDGQTGSPTYTLYPDDPEPYMTSTPIDFKQGWGLYGLFRADWRSTTFETSYWSSERFVPLLGSYHYANVSMNTSDMTYNRIRVLAFRGRHEWHCFQRCTPAIEATIYHHFPSTGDRTGYKKVHSRSADMLSLGIYLHLHPSFSLDR